MSRLPPLAQDPSSRGGPAEGGQGGGATALGVARRCVAVLSSGAMSGAVLGAITGYVLAPGGFLAAWQSAALGVMIGLGWGGVLAPAAALVTPARQARIRGWTTRHSGALVRTLAVGGGVVVGGFGVGVSVLPALLGRIDVPEVAAFVATTVVLGSTGLLVVLSLLGLRLCEGWACWWSRQSERAKKLLVVLGGLVLLLLAVRLGDWLPESSRPGGRLLVAGALWKASHSWDVGGALVLILCPALAVALVWLAARWRGFGLVAMLPQLALLIALALTRDITPLLFVPGPRAMTVALVQRAVDRDGDGYPRLFGGLDCDDGDARVHPGAVETPGNGRDEDCEGGDLDPAVLSQLDLPDPMTSEVRAALEEKVPGNLDVVLLTVDALRADLHYAGNPLPVSPYLDRLAERAVVFKRVYATASSTLRSLPAAMTGRYAEELVRTRGDLGLRFGRANVLLPERLQQAGWRSTLVPGCYEMMPQKGISQGIDTVLWDAITGRATGFDPTDARIADRVIGQLQMLGERGGPFFLWAHFVDPHHPYQAHAEVEGIGSRSGDLGLYWQEVAWTDRQIGRVIHAIEGLPAARRNRTVVIVTSDHGEAFGEHGHYQHSTDLWEEMIRVPLLIWIPGLEPREVDTPRSLVDLAPTILDLARLPHPPPGQPDTMTGRSLVPDLLGFLPQKRVVYGELPIESDARADTRILVDGSWKLRQRGADVALFDLGSDPGEQVNVASGFPAELTRMRALLAGFRARLRIVAPVASPPADW